MKTRKRNNEKHKGNEMKNTNEMTTNFKLNKMRLTMQLNENEMKSHERNESEMKSN